MPLIIAYHLHIISRFLSVTSVSFCLSRLSTFYVLFWYVPFSIFISFKNSLDEFLRLTTYYVCIFSDTFYFWCLLLFARHACSHFVSAFLSLFNLVSVIYLTFSLSCLSKLMHFCNACHFFPVISVLPYV